MDGTDTELARRTTAREETEAGESGRRARVRAAATRLFSPRAFLLALVLATVGTLLGGALPLVGSVGALLGVFAAGFALALLGGARYVEIALAGAAASVVGLLTDYFFLTMVGAGQRLALVGAGAGLLAGVLGHYFGRDLRAGITRDL